ncbi:uncharacterized protein LOC144608445 [Rhinoraja longicauda]
MEETPPEYKEMVPGVNTTCDIAEMDQAFQQMELAAEPEHLAQIGSMETFEYSFTKSKRKIDCKNQQTKFSLEHYQGLDEGIKYSEELFDEINDDDDDSTNMLFHLLEIQRGNRPFCPRPTPTSDFRTLTLSYTY